MPPLPLIGPNAYDPRQHGAECARCPLGPSPGEAWRFVPPDPADDPELVVVLEAPGLSEVEERRPACGKSGRLLDSALMQAGSERGRVTVTNAILCRPPDDGDLDVYLQKTKRENRKRLRDGREPWLLPTEACRPRLLRELGAAPFIAAMGKFAASALLGEDVAITTISGAPDVWEVPEEARAGAREQGLVPRQRIPFLATVHPAFVLRFGRYKQHFLNHVQRAVKRARGIVEWVEPERIYAPTAAVLHAWMKERRDRKVRVAYDYETTVTGSPATARPRCIGFGDRRSAIVVPFLSPDPAESAKGEALYRDADEARRMHRVLAAWLADPALAKSGWNEGIFDREVARQQFGVIPASVRDGILMHRLLYPEVGHSLDYAGRDMLDVAAWKRGHTATEARTMAELMAYNATDCVVTARLDAIMAPQVEARRLTHVLDLDHRIQEVCRGLHVNGIWIDQERRFELLRDWRERLERFRYEVVHIARGAGFARAIEPGPYAGSAFNPNSTRQVTELLFEHWGLDPTHETKLGDASTEDAALREIILGNADPTVRAWVVAFRRLRRAVKVVGTYLEESHAWESDGRVHATWLPHGTGVARRSCSGPNMQTLPYYLRGMIAAEEGRTLVYADWSQIHLRIIAGEAQDKLLMEQFQNAIDPHKWHAELFYGDEWRASVAERAALEARLESAGTPFAKKDKRGGLPAAVVAEMARIDQLGQALEGMRNSSKCVAAGTRVPVPGHGLVRIEEFLPTGGLPEGAFGEPQFAQVLGAEGRATSVQAAFYGGETDTVRVTTSTGYVLEGRPEHPVMLESGEWRRLDALQAGDTLRRWSPDARVFPHEVATVPINPWVSKRGPNAASRGEFPVDAPGLPRIRVDVDFAYMLGAVQGDGTFSNNTVSVCGLAQDGVTGEVERIWRAIGLDPRVRVDQVQNHQPLTTVLVHSTPFREFLSSLGMTSRREWRAASFKDGRRDRSNVTKVLRVPDVLFRSPAPVVSAYLAGLFDTDGTMGGGSLSFTSASRDFVLDVKYLLDCFGIRTRIGPAWNERYQKMYWRLALTREQTAAAADVVPMRCVRKRGLLRAVAGKTHRQKPAATTRPEEVVSIEAGRAKVYDVTVPQGHAFQAGGFVNHNTSTYCLMYLATLETFFSTMTGVEDGPEGNLIYASFTMRQARRIYKLFWGAHPSMLKWGEKIVQSWRERGVVTDSILGRPCQFLDGEDKNAIVNWPVLSAEQSHAIPAILRAVEQVPFGYAGHGTGMVHDGHDSVTFEVPEEDGERVAAIVNGAMQSEHKGVPLTSEVKKGRWWDKQEKWKPPG